MMTCPRDHQHLLDRRSAHGVTYHCPGCQGASVGLAIFRRQAGNAAADLFWQQAQAHAGGAGAPCPACTHAMRKVVVAEPDQSALEFDVCTRCLLVWFDGGELEQLRARIPAREQETESQALARRRQDAVEESKRRLRETTARVPMEPLRPRDLATWWVLDTVLDAVIDGASS